LQGAVADKGVEKQESTKEVCEESILERREEGLAIFGHTLEILPLHLEGFLQSSIGSLRVLPGSFGKPVNAQQPMVDFRKEPRVKLVRVTTNKSIKVAVPSANFQSKGGEKGLGSRLMGGGNNKNTLGGLRKIAIG